MAKLAVRFLILSILTTSLAIVPAVTQLEAATTSHKHMKKRVRVVQPSPRANPSTNPFASSYDNDFDRKSAGGGGGY